MKRIFIAGLMALLFAAAPATASVKSFTFTFAGNGVDNSATATGFITFDMALLTNPGRNVFDTSIGGIYSTKVGPYAYYGDNIPGLVTALSVTVRGATTGNGTFTLPDFDGVLFDTTRLGVNMNQQLVGQSLVNIGPTGETWSWGSVGPEYLIVGSDPAASYVGDFQLFSPSDSNAPTGGNPFTIQSFGDDMTLTSFTPVPEPSTYLLLSLGIGGLALLRRRGKS